MPRKVHGSAFALATAVAAATAVLAWSPRTAQAACPASVTAPVAHARLFEGGECKTNGVKVPFYAWGQILLENGALGRLECVNLLYGYGENATEPGGSGNSEKAKAYDKILQASPSAFLNTQGREPSAACRSSSGLEAWLTPERLVQQQPMLVDEWRGVTEKTPNGMERVLEPSSTELNTSERFAIEAPFGLYTGRLGSYGLGHYRARHRGESPIGEGSNETGTYRERSSTPWNGEAEATEDGFGNKFFFLRTGIALTERAEVEAEEGPLREQAGTEPVPTELRTGCYPYPETEKVTLKARFGRTLEELTALRPAPEGCIEANLIAPEAGIEQVFQGTLEPQVINGPGCLIASKAELKGTLESNGYHLESSFGPGYTKTQIPIKGCGFLSQQLLTLRLLP